MDAMTFLGLQGSDTATYQGDGSGNPGAKVSSDYIRKRLRDKGYSEAGADGILRNIMRESGGDPTIPGDDGTSAGLFQHHEERLTKLKQYAADKGKPWTDPDVQIDFADQEMKTQFPALREQMVSSKDPDAAYKAFKDVFERPKETGIGTGAISFSPYAMREYEGRNGTDLVHMRPSDYLALSPELEDPWGDASGRSLKASLDRGDQIESLPTLTVKAGANGSGEVTDQDGRHRAQAALEGGAESIPVAIQKTGSDAPLTEIQGMRGNVLPYDFKPVSTASRGTPGIMDFLVPKAEAATIGGQQMGPPSALPSATPQPQGVTPQLAQNAALKRSAEDFLSSKNETPPSGGSGGAEALLDKPDMTPLQSFGTGVKDAFVGAANLVNKIPGPLDFIPGATPQPAQQYQAQLDQANQARNREIAATGGDNLYRMGGQAIGQTALGLAASPALTGAGEVAGQLGAAALRAPASSAAGFGARALPASAGALAGATQPTRTDKLSEIAWNAVLGGAGGAVGGKIANTLSSLVAPAMKPLQRLLSDEGVGLTPGQMAGGIAQRIENKLSSLPIVGDMIKAAERRGFEDFNQAAINRSLSDIGQKLPKGVVGHEAIALAESKFRDAYDQLIPKMVGQLDPGLQKDLAGIAGLGQNLPGPLRDELMGVLKNSVLSKFSQGGGITGKAAQDIGTDLGSMAKSMGRSESPYTRQLGKAIQEIDASMDRMMARTNPQLQAAKDQIDAGYAKFKIVQQASRMAGTDDGLFTPSQLSSAVLSRDRSKDKAAFARGAALMQDLSDAAKSVLPSKVPNSGTADRYFMGTGAAALFQPHVAAGMALGAAPYTRPGINLANAYMRPGPTQNALANLLGQSGQFIAPAAGVAATQALPSPGQ